MYIQNAGHVLVLITLAVNIYGYFHIYSGFDVYS